MALIHDPAQAARLLKDGQLVALPTETVYGLGADAMNPDAVARIFEAKNRPQFDPLIVHVASIEQVSQVAEWNEMAERLFRAFAPGPLTLILKKKAEVPMLVTSGHPTVAVRIPAHPLMLEVLRLFGGPVAAPSANPFGYTSPTTAAHVERSLGDKISAVLDGGPCAIGVERTIVDTTCDPPRVLRLGGLELEALDAAVGQRLQVQTSSSNPTAPGMLSAHYNPGKQLILVDSSDEAALAQAAGLDAALLTFGDAHWALPHSTTYNLSPGGHLREAAANLFAGLRALAQTPHSIILAHKLPEEGLGRAINDRLLRASAKTLKDPTS